MSLSRLSGSQGKGRDAVELASTETKTKTKSHNSLCTQAWSYFRSGPVMHPRRSPQEQDGRAGVWHRRVARHSSYA